MQVLIEAIVAEKHLKRKWSLGGNHVINNDIFSTLFGLRLASVNNININTILPDISSWSLCALDLFENTYQEPEHIQCPTRCSE
jgi:type II secretory pathway component GspD/PulD (secretin)